jgi:hypothetical protein
MHNPHHILPKRVRIEDIGTWIRQRRQHFRAECWEAGLSYVEVDELGFESVMRETRRHLLAPSDRSPRWGGCCG